MKTTLATMSDGGRNSIARCVASGRNDVQTYLILSEARGDAIQFITGWSQDLVLVGSIAFERAPLDRTYAMESGEK